MSIRLPRTLIAVSVVIAVVGVVAVLPGSPRTGSKLVATRANRARSLDRAVVTGGAAQAVDPTGEPPTSAPPMSDPGTTAGTGTGTGIGSGTGTRGTSTSVTGPPTTRGGPATTTGPTTSPPQTPAGPATGRLAVTLGVVSNGGVAPGGGIATMAADGSDRRVLAVGNYVAPHWTPDGRFVLFSSTDSFDTWTVLAAGGPATLTAANVTGTLSPDGTRLVHWTAVPGSTAPMPLSVQPVAETATGLVASGPATSLGVSGFSPVWSPNGHRVLYAPQIGPFSDLAIVNADGTGQRDLLASAPVQAVRTTQPDFSADGSTIGFVGSDSRAYLMNVDGADLRSALPDVVAGITNLSVFSTAWSPDHQRLAALVDGGRSVVVVDANRRLVAAIHLPVQGFPIGIGFDGSGQDIFYMGSAESPPRVANLYSIALDGSRSHQLATDGSLMVVPAVLP
jgi:hypothetical protein